MQLQEASNVAVIVGENAVTVAQLPSVWQDIAKGRANVRFSNPQIYVEMAQLFQYKLQYGDVDSLSYLGNWQGKLWSFMVMTL
jgi:hypothetical protein